MASVRLISRNLLRYKSQIIKLFHRSTNATPYKRPNVSKLKDGLFVQELGKPRLCLQTMKLIKYIP